MSADLASAETSENAQTKCSLGRAQHGAEHGAEHVQYPVFMRKL